MSRQVYATKIQCDICGAQADVTVPDTHTAPEIPPGWLGPVWISPKWDGITPHDFCPGCAGFSVRDLFARLREIEEVKANG